MQEGPDISLIASLIGNPANANMLLALMPGRALTATELANGAGLTPQTTSGNLARLQDAGLVQAERQGRHRYFRLADADVAAVLEALLPVAARAGHVRARTGPRDPELRRARSCYDHLAGDLAVRMLATWTGSGLISRDGDTIAVSPDGRRGLARKGLDLAAYERERRPLCRRCLDWSERRDHLSGALGAGVFRHIKDRGWASQGPGSRVVRFAPGGEAAFVRWFGG